MSNPPRQFPRSFWLGSSLLFSLLGLTYLLAVLEDKKAHPTSLPVLNAIADFTLTNQTGATVTLADLTNHVWVADIIFTRCPGPCPRMSRQMKSLQDLVPATRNVRFVTLTTDPLYDVPAVMAKYADHYQADTNTWMFLTGAKLQIANLAAGSLKLGYQAIPPAERKDEFDLFIHSTIFVMVDKHARLRGIFQTGGDDVDWPSVQGRLLASLAQLEKEP